MRGKRHEGFSSLGASVPLLAIVLVAAGMPMSSCDSLPGGKTTQGVVIGGVGGAAAGAIIAGEDNRLLGAVIGTVIGAGGGYVVGNEIKKNDEIKAQEAAAKNGKTSAFTVEDVQRSKTADLDSDGNVTVAELVAMQRAGLTDAEIIRRLEATDVVFQLTDVQKQTLRDSGVSAAIVDKLPTINRASEPIGTRR